jgi:hypothetical protein
MNDLLLPLDSTTPDAILEIWSGYFFQKPYQLVGLSLFGDCFLQDFTGEIDMLDLVAAEVRTIATCREEFETLIELPAYQSEWLMSDLVRALEPLRPESGQCFAFRTPPVLGGELAPNNVIVWDLASYHTGLRQLYPQILDLPLGAHVIATR